MRGVARMILRVLALPLMEVTREGPQEDGAQRMMRLVLDVLGLR